jgi:hypothetical protein
VSVRDTDRGYRELLKRVKMPAVAIATGVLAKDGAQPKQGTEGALELIEVAVWNEFGTSRAPARSFIRAWFDAEEPTLREKLTVLLQEVVAGKLTRDQALERMGLYCVGAIQKRIAEGIAPENAPSTIEKKTKGAGGSTTPLVDTGQLRSSISYEVRQGGSGRAD